MKFRLALLLSVSAVFAVPAFAPIDSGLASLAQGKQDKPKPIPAHAKVDQEKVDEAIKNGCKYLINSGFGMGSSFTHGQRNQPIAVQAYSELVLLTLLHSGYYDDDPAIQPIADYVSTKIIGSTYTASLMAMALTKLNPKKYQQRIQQCAQFLCDNQCENGQWDYGEPVVDPPPTTYDLPKRKKPADVATGGDSATPGQPTPEAKEPAASSAGKTTVEGKKPGKTKTEPRIPVRKKKPGPPNGDNSNSQYAALGLRACLDANIDVDPAVLQRARQWWLKSQNSDGGWGYNDHGNTGGGDKNEGGVSNDSYGSMTVGAVGAMCIFDYYSGIDYKTDGNVIKGINWLANNFDVTKNPKKTSFAHLYYLYGLERVGMLFGTERLGAHEWYPEGANHLLTTQNNGVWGGKDNFPKEVQVDTCFAILFLRRGTPPLKPLPLVATGGKVDGAGAPVPNGPPIANGGNRDAGLVANKGVESVAPGWRLINCRPELQKTVAVAGKTNVLQTVEEGSARQPTLRRMIDAGAGSSIKAIVGHNPNDSWTLVVRVDGKELTTKPVSAESSKEGWTEISVDLAPFAGKSVLVELIAAGGESALWAAVSMEK